MGFHNERLQGVFVVWVFMSLNIISDDFLKFKALKLISMTFTNNASKNCSEGFFVRGKIMTLKSTKI